MSNDEKDFIFEMEFDSKVGRIVDAFRWNFTHTPFFVTGPRTVLTRFTVFSQPRFKIRQATAYYFKFVAASWAEENGVSLYAFVFSFTPMRSQEKA